MDAHRDYRFTSAFFRLLPLAGFALLVVTAGVVFAACNSTTEKCEDKCRTYVTWCLGDACEKFDKDIARTWCNQNWTGGTPVTHGNRSLEPWDKCVKDCPEDNACTGALYRQERENCGGYLEHRMQGLLVIGGTLQHTLW